MDELPLTLLQVFVLPGGGGSFQLMLALIHPAHLMMPSFLLGAQ